LNYPETWNVAVENYYDLKKKKWDAWISICWMFCGGFDEKDINEYKWNISENWKNKEN
jgi:hypothetical protein